jgi:dipeptidase
MEKFITYIKGETVERMPLWIKPVKKISVQDMKMYMRDQYEGTELDITKGFGAGLYGSKLRLSPLSFELDGVTYYHERPIATQQTGFTFIAQMRNWMPPYVGGILWFGVDDAATNIYMPIYCGINSVPNCLNDRNGSLVEYSPTSSFWIFNTVSNMAYNKYSLMMPDIKKVQQHWETNFHTMIPSIDKTAIGLPETNAREFLTTFSQTQAENATAAWKKLGEYLLVKYLDGVIKKEENGRFMQNQLGIPPGVIRPGYPEEYLRELVKQTPGMKAKTQEELDKRKSMQP